MGSKDMTFLIVGLGSMGKRRIRNLQHLKAGEILGFDLMESRRKEVKEKYNIETIKDIKDTDINKIDAFIISTPPDKHNQYIKFAIDNKKPAFVEASVILEGLEELNKAAKRNKVLVAPSCTFRFHPAIKVIKKIVKSGSYGKVTNFVYICGQYLPDWHPWQNVKNFYVSKKETSAAREMVTFEMTWIVDVVGFPKQIKGFYGRTMDVKADIDDTYVFCCNFGNAYGSIVIDVVSRYAMRSLILNMERGQILWRWDENVIKLYNASNKQWINYPLARGHSEKDYNKNIVEEMYIEEIKTFLEAANGKKDFPNTLNDDIEILKLLEKIEEEGK